MGTSMLLFGARPAIIAATSRRGRSTMWLPGGDASTAVSVHNGVIGNRNLSGLERRPLG